MLQATILTKLGRIFYFKSEECEEINRKIVMLFIGEIIYL